jgi:hypothetical protein
VWHQDVTLCRLERVEHDSEDVVHHDEVGLVDAAD